MKRGNFIKSKNSQGHVEMILSFVIFIGFLLAIFLFIIPTKEITPSYAILNNAEEIILKNISINYYYTSLILKSEDLPPGENCFSILNQPGLSQILIVRDLNNLVKDSSVNSKISIDPTPDNRLYELYFSNAFNEHILENPENCFLLSEDNYSFGILINSNKVLYENLEALENAYVSDYQKLKSDLNLNNDFSFAVYNLTRGVLFNQTLSMHKLSGINVLSREIPLKAMNREASQSDIIFNLRVW